MKRLQSIINESLIYEYMDFLQEDPINEGVIQNGLKKLWKYVKNKFLGKKNLSDQQLKHPKLSMVEYDYSKVMNKLSRHVKKIKVDKKRINDIKIILTNINDSDIWEAMLLYVPFDKTPFAKDEKMKKYSYIYGFNLSDDYEEAQNIIFLNHLITAYNNIKNNSGNFTGFAISEDTYKSNTIYSSVGFEDNIKITIEKKEVTLYYMDYKSIKTKIKENFDNNDNVLVEELDDNMFYLLDIWFSNREKEYVEFTNLVMRCKQDGMANDKKLGEYIKGTFLETQINQFVNFIENDLIPNENKNNLYSLKKIIDRILFDKTNKYIKKGEA